MGGDYVEGQVAPLFAQLVGESRQPFPSLLSTLALLERDVRVATVVIHVRELEIGWGKAEELRGAIRRLRDAGRRTIAFVEVASFSPNLEYFVASAADEVRLPPGAAMPMVGLAAEYLYLGGLFEKLGVDIEVAKVGRFKSAPESFAEKAMSESSRLQANALLDSTFDGFLAAIAEGRGMSIDLVRRAIDAGPTRADELRELGLIDGVAHLSAITDELGAPVVEYEDYLRVTPEDVGFEAVAELALIYGAGNVVSGSGSSSRTGEPVFASETVSQALRDASEDPRFSAIILRIDSPGGSALASEMIWDAIQDARASKPVVASFSDVAASGGYYVASGADAIIASPLTITGSIGVFALRPVVEGLLDEVGIGVESLTRGRHADFYLSSRPLSAGTAARMQGLVDETYELFVERVSSGREMSVEDVDRVAQGRVWTGVQAHEVGLVDELGGLRTAVDWLRAKLSLAEDADVALVPYPAAPTLAEQVRELLDARVGWLADPPWMELAKISAPTSRTLSRLRELLHALPLDEPLALAPVLPVIR
jgi:protease-4